MEHSPHWEVFGDTAVLILETAERLFAEDGVADLSARRLISEAGQRNQRAIAYHFGDMEGVVAALIRMRRQDLNARELAEMSALAPITKPARSRQGAERELERYMRALVKPTCDVCMETRWGASFVKVLPALLLRLSPMLRQALPARLWSAHEQFLAAYGTLLPEIPEAIRLERTRLALAMLLNASSGWVSNSGDGVRARSALRESFAHLAKLASTALCAPNDSTEPLPSGGPAKRVPARRAPREKPLEHDER